MAWEWGQGFVVGLSVGAAPTLYCIGGQMALSHFMESRAAMAREIHKAVIDVGGRVASYFNKESKPYGKVEENNISVVSDSNRAAASSAVVAPLPGGRGRGGIDGADLAGRVVAGGSGLRGTGKSPRKSQQNDERGRQAKQKRRPEARTSRTRSRGGRQLGLAL